MRKLKWVILFGILGVLAISLFVSTSIGSDNSDSEDFGFQSQSGAGSNEDCDDDYYDKFESKTEVSVNDDYDDYET